MGSRKDKCSRCGALLLVPFQAQTIRCSVCQEVTRHRPNDPLGQAQESIGQAAIRLKGFLNTVSSNINTMVASVNNNPMPATSSYGYYPQLIRPPPLVVPFSANGRKRAVLCGVSYYGTRNRLKGSINDISCMRYFLVQKLGFPNDSIVVLSEEETDPYRIPTKYNIQNALKWLVQGCQSGDSLVFHYSGHGSQRHDFDRDEMDGFDETLLPVDHETAGTIVDDEINAIIVRPLPRGAKLHAIIDACHSGTILDLPFVCRMNREGYYIWEDHSHLSATFKGTSGGVAISFSACDDHQISVDTTILPYQSRKHKNIILIGFGTYDFKKPISNILTVAHLCWWTGNDITVASYYRVITSLSGYTSTGAMTYSFIQAVQNEPGLTYGCLLNAMRHTIRESKTGVFLNGPISSLLRKVYYPAQEPQLSSSERFDVYSTPFAL